MVQNRNPAVDIAKYLAALLVVVIHTALFSDYNDTLNFVVVHIICRTAVPFFAVCTGYFLGGRLSFGDRLEKTRDNLNVFVHRWKKVFILYFVWSCLYLVFSIPSWIQTGWFSPWAFVDYAVGAITNGSHYQLWYLLFLLYSLPFVYVFLRLFSTKHQWLPILLCWIIAIFAYTYNSFIPVNILPSAELMDTFSHIPTLTSLILVGVGISQERKRRHRAYYAIGFVISFGLLFAEAFALRHFGIKNVSYIIFTLPTAYFLFH